MEKDFLGRGWAFPLAVDGNGRIALTEFEDDIREAVRLVLLTALGERPMRPDFGSGLHDAVFTTLNTTTLGQVQADVRRALVRWEPRIEVLEVVVKPQAGDIGTLLIDVDYRVRANNTVFNLVFPFYLGTPT